MSTQGNGSKVPGSIDGPHACRRVTASCQQDRGIRAPIQRNDLTGLSGQGLVQNKRCDLSSFLLLLLTTMGCDPYLNVFALCHGKVLSVGTEPDRLALAFQPEPVQHHTTMKVHQLDVIQHINQDQQEVVVGRQVHATNVGTSLYRQRFDRVGLEMKNLDPVRHGRQQTIPIGREQQIGSSAVAAAVAVTTPVSIIGTTKPL